MSEDHSAWEGFFTFMRTKVFEWVINCPCKIICLFSGNQFGKNETIAMDYILRCMGLHPIKHKNLTKDDKIRTFRFASQTLPSDKEGDEVSNTQYPVLKRRIPDFMIARDITFRKPVLTINSDNGPVQFEFVSYYQAVQSGAGVQRKSIWIDEECNKDFFEEQIPRLLAADGDIIFSFTPVPGSIGWEFDDLYERAKYIYRTDAVRARIKARTGEDYPECEITDSDEDIAVIMAATDDNPIYEILAAEKSKRLDKPITAKEYLDEEFAKYADEDVVDARRYGLFRQLSGRIYKQFGGVHIIPTDKYFSEGVPSTWKFFRGVDYHTSNPWACVWTAISPDDEMFVYCDYAPDPKRMVTYDIALNIAQRSGDYRYSLDLIDPLAQEKQVNTNLSTAEDLNRYFLQFKRDSICSGSYWQSWDTKGTRGREELQYRLANSIKCGKPYNNLIVEDGKARRLPTLWVTSNCKSTIEGLKNWRMDEWKSREMLSKKDSKETPETKWSHFPIAIECLLKNPMISRPKFGITSSTQRPKTYFAGVR